VSNFIYCYAECHYAGCRYAECRLYTECRRYTECHRYAECGYTQCHSVKCRRAVNSTFESTGFKVIKLFMAFLKHLSLVGLYSLV
jgi:hypothetical protein